MGSLRRRFRWDALCSCGSPVLALLRPRPSAPGTTPPHRGSYKRRSRPSTSRSGRGSRPSSTEAGPDTTSALVVASHRGMGTAVGGYQLLPEFLVRIGFGSGSRNDGPRALTDADEGQGHRPSAHPRAGPQASAGAGRISPAAARVDRYEGDRRPEQPGRRHQVQPQRAGSRTAASSRTRWTPSSRSFAASCTRSKTLRPGSRSWSGS